MTVWAPCFLEYSLGFLASGGERVAVMDARFLRIIDNRGVPSDNNASGLDAYLKAFSCEVKNTNSFDPSGP